MKISKRAELLSPSAIIAIGENIEKSAPDVDLATIDLAEGDPDFPTPQPIVDCAVEALQMNKTHYVESRGVKSLRDAIISYSKGLQAAGYDAERNLVVTPGAKFAIYSALMCMINPGDRVIVFEPAWVSYDSMILLCGGEPLRWETSSSGSFFPDLKKMQSAPGDNVQAMIINSPNNPTGRVYSQEEMAALLDYAAANDIYLISDEIYNELVYDVSHVSVTNFPEHLDRVLLVGGFSKTFAMTGWRLGYVAGPENIIQKIVEFQQHTITCATSFVQLAAIEALESGSVSNAVGEMLQEYRRRRNLVVNYVAQIPKLNVSESEGAFYAWIDISGVTESSRDFAARLIQKYRVLVVPGIAFGQSGEGFIRLCFAREPIDRLKVGLQRIADCVDGWKDDI